MPVVVLTVVVVPVPVVVLTVVVVPVPVVVLPVVVLTVLLIVELVEVVVELEVLVLVLVLVDVELVVPSEVFVGGCMSPPQLRVPLTMVPLTTTPPVMLSTCPFLHGLASLRRPRISSTTVKYSFTASLASKKYRSHCCKPDGTIGTS